MEPNSEGTGWPKKRHVTGTLEDAVEVSAVTDVDPVLTMATGDNISDDHNTRAGSPVLAKSVEQDIETNGKYKEQDHAIGICSKIRKLCSCGVYIPKRYIVASLLGVGMLFVYAMRTNVGVTVVMILDERAHEKVGTIDAILQLPHITWDSRMIGFLHSIFYVGYITSQIPGAFFTTMWPTNKLLGVCILVSALLNLLLPVCIEHGEYSLTCVIRCCQGLSEGLLYPACYGVLRYWSTPAERSRVVSTVLTCAYAGAIVGFPVAGLITHYIGWQYVYYVFGAACILWYLFWLCLSFEKPSHHTTISDSEFEYMDKSTGHDAIDYENAPMPWKDIVTSLPVISICFCHFVRHWVFILMLTNEPLYLNEFGFNIAETGFYASFPHIAKVILALCSGCLADSLLNTQILSTTVVRKLLTGIGLSILAACFFILTYLDTGISVIVVLSIALGAFGISTSGWSVNHYDLSTRHASSLVAVTSTFGTLGAITVPLVVGEFTIKQDLEGWDNVFYLTAAIVTFAVIFYTIFGSGEQQPWANPPANIKLVQKLDPLARKPYKIHILPKQPLVDSTYNNSNDGNDKASLIQARTGHGYGATVEHLEQQLSNTLDGADNR